VASLCKFGDGRLGLLKESKVLLNRVVLAAVLLKIQVAWDVKLSC
jgi:hypothetical protein